MTKLPVLKARNLVKILHKLGFGFVRQKGLLGSILDDIKISPEEFEKLR